MSSMSRLSFTLAILKPDLYANASHHGRVVNAIKAEGFKVAKETVKSWNSKQVRSVYA